MALPASVSISQVFFGDQWFTTWGPIPFKHPVHISEDCQGCAWSLQSTLPENLCWNSQLRIALAQRCEFLIFPTNLPHFSYGAMQFRDFGSRYADKLLRRFCQFYFKERVPTKCSSRAIKQVGVDPLPGTVLSDGGRWLWRKHLLVLAWAVKSLTLERTIHSQFIRFPWDHGCFNLFYLPTPSLWARLQFIYKPQIFSSKVKEKMTFGVHSFTLPEVPCTFRCVHRLPPGALV